MRTRPALLAAAVALTVTGVGACVHDRTAARVEGQRPHATVGPAAAGPVNVYSHAATNMLSPAVRDDRPLVYVPETLADTVTVIDPKTYTVIGTFPGGHEPQHIVPAYNLRTLFVTSSRVPGGGIIAVNPTTGQPVRQYQVPDVYNLYFTPDGRHAIVVAEYYQRLDFYDPSTWQRVASVDQSGCEGINHMDFSADERVALVSCEFGNRMIVIDANTGRRLRGFALDRVSDGMPQDTRLVPNGTAFLVADMHANGLYVFNGDATAMVGFIPTGRGAHGIYFSRDGRVAYVSNRDEGSISVIDLATLKPVGKWWIPGGSPDMGGLSADGTVLWLSGRYTSEVYAISTATGRLLARIPVGPGPHGLLVWPQPGRYSLGHTENIR
ncbi:MAG: beta-propeller fold lactonase family protein [Betaproteobacteria bacterium]